MKLPRLSPVPTDHLIASAREHLRENPTITSYVMIDGREVRYPDARQIACAIRLLTTAVTDMVAQITLGFTDFSRRVNAAIGLPSGDDDQ